MAIYDDFPYTNFHDLNLDWVVKTVKQVKDKTDEIDNSVAEAKGYAEASEENATTVQGLHDDFINKSEDMIDQINANTENIRVNTSRIDGIVALQDGSTTGDAELQDIRVWWNGDTSPTAGDAVRGQVDYLNNNLDILLENATIDIPLNITNGGCYPVTTKEFWANSGFRCAIITATEHDVIHVSSQSDTNVPIAMFYSGVPSSATYIGYYGLLTQHLYTDELLTIPAGTTHIVLNCYQFSPPFYATKEGKKPNQTVLNKKISASYDGTTITLRSRYNGSSDIEYTFCKRGGNNLLDLNTIKTINDNGSESTLLTNPTDTFSPYKLRAAANADGDLPSGWTTHFTGGNHQYNNTGSGSTATARCVIDAVLFDKEIITNSSEYCDTAEIYWTNYIQGQNTKKSDGSGREILKECYHLTFDGTDFTINHYFEPLEDVTIKDYYGMGFYWYNGSGYHYQYVGGTNRKELNAPLTSDSGNKYCRKFLIYDTNIVLTAEMLSEDLGDWILDNDTYSAFSTPYNKIYFNLVNGAAFQAVSSGDRYFYKAKISFKANI